MAQAPGAINPYGDNVSIVDKILSSQGSGNFGLGGITPTPTSPVTVRPTTTTATKPTNTTPYVTPTAPATGYKTLTTNQRDYLYNLIKTGTPGQVTWARDQLMNVYGVPKTQVDHIIPTTAVNAGYGAPVIANQQGLNAATSNGQIQNVGGTAPTGGGGTSGGGGGGAVVPTVGGAAPTPTPTPTLTAQNNTDIFRTSPYASGRMIGELPVGPEYWTGDQMAGNLGLIYDFEKLLQLKQDAINTQYANLDNEWGRTKDAYYDAIGTNANALLGTLKRGDMAAARAGTASGTNAATQLSALLGLSADASVGATDMAQQRADLISEREAALAKATSDTLTEHNNLGTLVGNIINSKYNAENNAYAAAIASLLGLDTAVLSNQSAEKMNAAQIAAQIKNAEIAAAAQVAASKSYGSSYGGSSSGAASNQDFLEKLTGLNTAYEAAVKGGNTALAEKLLAEMGSLVGVTAPAATSTKGTSGSTTPKWLQDIINGTGSGMRAL